MQGKNSKENRDNLVNYYDEYVERQKNVGVNKRHHSILNKLINAGLKNNDRVLEIGCGIGTFTGLLIDYLQNGKLVSVDIGGKNIEEAQKSLGHYKNVTFIHDDAVTHEFLDSKFEVVVLPDVLEHIPIEGHYELFRKISEILEPNGFVFIHIPNPEYLEWCHANRPDLLQIIDQPIFTNLLVESTLPHGLVIKKLETYSIWIEDGDYQYIVLHKKGHEDFSKVIEEKITLLDKIKYKLNAKRK